MDCLKISRLPVACVIGVRPQERLARQVLKVTVSLFGQWQKAGRSDSLNDAVDYAALSDQIIAEIGATSYQLIESVADHIVRIALQDRRVQRVEVVIEKSGVLPGDAVVEVLIARDWESEGKPSKMI